MTDHLLERLVIEPLNIDRVIDRWLAAFDDDEMIDALSLADAREAIREMLSDMDSLVTVAEAARAYGRARIAASEAFERAPVAPLPGAFVDTPELVAARRAKDTALDRLEAIAVQLAGGDAAKVCGSEAADG